MFASVVVHLLRRCFRGPVRSKASPGILSQHSDLGEYVEYESGYIEYVARDGKKTDIQLQMWMRAIRHRLPGTWRAGKTHGGGALTLKFKTRQSAINAVSLHGAVIHVDDQHRYIFYKDFE
jgi:hypothetical protein